MSRKHKFSQINGRTRLLITAALLILQPVISVLALIPQAAHADVASGDIVFNNNPSTNNGQNSTVPQIAKLSSSTVSSLNSASGGLADGQPEISPDGSKIAFIGQRLAGDVLSTDPNYPQYEWVLMTMNSDGSGQTPINKPLFNADPVTGFQGGHNDSSPHWSSDGKQLLYTHCINDKTFNGTNGFCDWTIHKVSVDSSGNPSGDTRLTTGGIEDSAVWSPDGTKIAYSVVDYFGTGASQVYIMNSDGTNQHAIAGSTTGYSDEAPTWSPDGSKIYFYSSEGGIYLYASTDGFSTTTNVTRSSQPVTTYNPSSGLVSTPNLSYGYHVGISGNGNTLTFASNSAGNNCYPIYTVSASGGTPTSVHDPLVNGICQAWESNPVFVNNAWPTANAKSVVALGDSVAAGEGINYGWVWQNGAWVKTGPNNPTWSDTTAGYGSNEQNCHQSDYAYSRLFYADNYKVKNIACTSASAMYQNITYPTGGVLTKEKFYDNSQNPPTLIETAPRAQLGSSSVTGADVPNSAYDSASPDIVTLTLGADDINFVDWLAKCYDAGWFLGPDHSIAPAACNNTGNDTAVNNLLIDAKANLHKALQEIHDRGVASGKIPHVYVTGYYDPFPAVYNSSCSDLVTPIPTAGLTSDEITWLRNKLVDLNGNINNEANQFGNVTYVDITNVMQPSANNNQDHAFCSSDPWVYGASIAINYDLHNPSPYHPTPAGQQRIYQAVKSAISTPYATGSTAGNGQSVTSFGMGIPSTAAAGNVAVASFQFAGGSTPTITAPTGWTLDKRQNDGTTEGIAVYHKVLVAGDLGTAPLWSLNSSRNVSGVLRTYSGVDATAPLAAVAVGANGSASTSVPASSVTTGTANAEIITIHGQLVNIAAPSNVWTPPAGQSEVADVASQQTGGQDS